MTVTDCTIRLEGLRFHAFHGVLKQERTVGGSYTLDLALHLADAATAIQHDQLDGTVNYAEVYEVVNREMAVPSALLEHAAGRILEAVFTAFPSVDKACIALRKDNPPMGADCKGCSVELEAVR